MPVVRHLLAQRRLAVLICTAALLVKLLVPTGYMIDRDHSRLRITLCAGVEPRPAAMDMPGMHGDTSHEGGSKDHGKAEMPCAFSGLSTAALGAIDPVQLAALIVFIVAVGRATTVLPEPSRRVYLRPPLRGPPATF